MKSMIDAIGKLAALLSNVRNPVPAVLDRLRLQTAPYTLALRSGLTVELRPQSGDLFGFYEILLRRDYLSSGQLLEAGGTVIDVGANIGCFAIEAARIVGPAGRVLALEPEEATYRQLVRNVELNRMKNVIPLRIAVGGREAAIKLHTPENRLFSSVFDSVNGQEVGGSEQIVRMTTLEGLMKRHRIVKCDYLKIDCEGAEHEIIATMTRETAARIAQITMEVHKVPGHDGAELEGSLKSLGYRRLGSSTLPFYSRRP